MVVSWYETAFMPIIVERIYSELGLKLHTTPSGLTGIETRAEGINSWLRYEQLESPVLAICGMGGSGKTTLAKHIYYSNKQNFESSSLLEEMEKQPDGLLGVQKKLKDISRNNNIIISDVYEGTLQIQKVMQQNRVLIVVDDIDDKDKLITLIGTYVFHTQSKIILTTRLLNINTWFGSICWRCHVQEVELLTCHESLELLSWYAFGLKFPTQGFEKLAIEVTQYCGGNPLALKVLGSSLIVSTQNSWTKNNMLEIWRSKVNSLNSLRGDLDSNIQVVLKKSFESLPCKSHKELFLHIACLFIGQYSPYVELILEKDWCAKSGIATLSNRCLLTVSRDTGRLVIHKLLVDMARSIVLDESKDPVKRSRVWDHDESYRLLAKGDGSETIEGLTVDMREAEQEIKLEAFKTSSLVKMKILKLLQLYAVKLTGSFENFPNLRCLCWRGCNVNIIPSGLLMSTLVAIDMSYGGLEKFEPPVVLNSLKTLDLSCSYKLISICSLHRLPKLWTLSLASCTNLSHVCKTVGDLKDLSYLYLEGCTKLWKASSNQTFVNQLERLKALFISRETPEQPLFSLPQSLFQLSLQNNSFDILPNHIDLSMIWVLDLSCCPNLKSLPCLPSTLRWLEVNWCTSLERITFQSARFTLKEFSYEGCFSLSEIQGLFKLVPVAKLHEADLGHMQWIKVYQDHKVDLIGDMITKGRTWDVQMLYEYGIRGTYLQGIKDQSMTTHQYTSSSEFLSFRVPLHPKKNRIQGLNLAILYRSSSGVYRSMLPPLVKIVNGTKGLIWVYNPVVFCGPGIDEDAVWLSYWPIGKILHVGDEVYVNVLVDKQLTVRECGASLVYMDDGKVDKEEENSGMMKTEEVIGGDLSEFEVIKGGYYLCRHDFFQSRTPYVLKRLFGDNIHYTGSRNWRATHPLLSSIQ